MPQGTDTLFANESLLHGQSIISNNRIYQVVFQTDGNLVLYKSYPGAPTRALWASGTNGHPSDSCIMQGDGNLVLYDPGSHAIWAAGTYNHPGSRVVVQDDGNLVIYQPNNAAIWASNTVQNPVPNGPAASGTQMLPGQTLHKDQPIQSANGRYTFVFQSDGNLVLYKNYPTHPRKALWASNTNGRPAVVCIMQGDGNLVIYDSDAHALWASGSNGHANSHLVVQDDGNVVIYQPNNSPVWATNTVQITVPSGPLANGNTMHPGEILPINHPLRSANGRYTFIFQSDGNLVLYKNYPNHPTKALWASNTNGRAVDVCIMQGDGNLVLYDPDGHPVWASGTNGHPGSHLAVQDDGNVVIYQSNNTAVWATNTVQKTVPTGPAANGDTAHGGEILAVNHALRSANGRYSFIFQADGNLVLYKSYPTHPTKALWASNTSGRVVDVCIMQGDGNLVLYDPDGNAIWSSGSYNHPGSRLVVQNDGNVVIYQPNNAAVWATNTVQAPVPTGPQATGNSMQPGQILGPNQSLRSAAGRYLWILQGDGNLVLYKTYASGKQTPLWASNTNGRLADVCIMQNDGNLVIYDLDGHAIWASNTGGNPGTHLIVQDDGNVVIYRPNGSALWATGTNGMVVHFKTLLALTAAVQTYINTQFAALDELYIDGRVNTTMGTTEDLSGDTTLSTLLDLDVGACTTTSLTDEQRSLMGHRNNAGANDLVVYLVSTLTGGSGNLVGCASHPSDRPACAITQVAGADWLTAHEVGHVLGLLHVSTTPATNSDFLMWPNIGWTNLPPNLSSGEFQTMRNSGLTPVS